MDTIVFHLMTAMSYRTGQDVVLRYDHDPRCTVEFGDVWERTTTDGDVSNHRVANVRTFITLHGTETHAFLVPHTVPIAA